MFKKVFLITLVFCVGLFASTSQVIDKKINKNTNILSKKKKQNKKTSTKITKLAKHLKKEEKKFSSIDKKLSSLSNTILLNKIKLNKSKSSILLLESKAVNIKKDQLKIEQNIIDEITDTYSSSIGIELAKESTIQEIIDKEVYLLLLEESSDNIIQLNLEYLQSTSKKRKNKTQIKKLTKYIKQQEKKKLKYMQLKKEKENIIKKLSKQHINYQKQLKNIISKQEKLQDLLSDLNILKKKEIKKERLRQKKLKLKMLQKKKELARKKALKDKALKNKAKNKLKSQNKIKAQSKLKTKEIQISSKRKLDEDIDINVRNIGSSTKGIKISKYKGSKTISPLKSYTITKKFGKYYDSVYKIELFNEALSMKPKRSNSKVYNILSGKVIYAKKNSGTLENVVIVKHKKGLHTIYSHLDKISSNLRIGKWIKKGYVVGRVNDTLMFQVTKNNRYINPKELFR